MIIDSILDRKDGRHYSAHDFYIEVRKYERLGVGTNGVLSMKAYIVRYWVHKDYEIDSFFYKKEEAEKRVQEINDSNNSWDSLVNYADIEEIECC